MGKNRKNKYRQVNTLPKDAVKVSEFAKSWPCNTSYLYKLIKENKNKTFEMIDFHGINFIIPK